jgi:sortase A
MVSTSTQPGWYRDPSDPSKVRWFDGVQWTDYAATAEPGVLLDPPPGFSYDSPGFAHIASGVSSTSSSFHSARSGVDTPVADRLTVLDPSLSSTPPKTRRKPFTALKNLVLPKKISSTTVFRFVGVILIACSFSVVGYVLYQNTATARQAAASQDKLENQLNSAATIARTASSVEAAIFLPPNISSAPLPSAPATPPLGEAAARIQIPVIGVDWVVSAGSSLAILEKGPGLWETGPMPGSPGNATIAAHRTTWGAPFKNIDDLKLGDNIVISVPGRPDSVYEVRGTQIVSPSETGVTAQTSGSRLTLVSCDPPGSTGRRIVVQAEMVKGEFASIATPVTEWAFQR